MTPEEALRALSPKPLPPETILLRDALGRTLAEDVTANRDEPPYDMSEKDGYAIRFSDLPGPLKVVGKAGPGERPALRLGKGECTMASTGSYLPKGADTVVPIEHVEFLKGSIYVKMRIDKGTNILRKGSDFTKNSVIVKKGSVVTPQVLALLKFAGVKRVKVAPRISIGFLSIGTELKSGRVRTINAFMLTLLARALGFRAENLGIAGDDPLEISQMLVKAIKAHDLIVTTGGSSVGERDLTHDALARTGGKLIFKGMKIRPGRTTSAYELDGKKVFLLAGVFQAALAGFLMSVVPFTMALQGLDPELPYIYAKMGATIKNEMERIVWARLTHNGVVLPMASHPLSKSHLIKANCFVIVRGSVRKGERVKAYLIPGLFSTFTLLR